MAIFQTLRPFGKHIGGPGYYRLYPDDQDMLELEGNDDLRGEKPQGEEKTRFAYDEIGTFGGNVNSDMKLEPHLEDPGAVQETGFQDWQPEHYEQDNHLMTTRGITDSFLKDSAYDKIERDMKGTGIKHIIVEYVKDGRVRCSVRIYDLQDNNYERTVKAMVDRDGKVYYRVGGRNLLSDQLPGIFGIRRK